MAPNNIIRNISSLVKSKDAHTSTEDSRLAMRQDPSDKGGEGEEFDDSEKDIRKKQVGVIISMSGLSHR